MSISWCYIPRSRRAVLQHWFIDQAKAYDAFIVHKNDDNHLPYLAISSETKNVVHVAILATEFLTVDALLVGLNGTTSLICVLKEYADLSAVFGMEPIPSHYCASHAHVRW
jgi:hypothetical protein